MRARISAAVFFFAIAAALSAASLPDFLSPEPGFAELGALSEPLDLPSLERAALLASGVSADGLGPYEARLGAVIDRADREAVRGQSSAAKAAAGAPTAASDQAEALLGSLHQNLLRAYREDATTVDGILDSGYYNCVSSAVLYALAARSLGLDVAGVRTSDHAFCTVQAGGRSVDVETTNPYGFDPGGKKEFKDSFGRVTGFAYVAPGGYGDRKQIGLRDLIGLILSNRASSLERQGRFADATKIGADYAALCPGEDSRSFLTDRINNLVASLDAARDYGGAETTAVAAAAAMPDEAKLAAIAKNASYNRAAALAQAGDWDGALEAALRMAAAAPGDRAAADLVTGALSSMAQSYAQKGDFAGARAAIAARAAKAGSAATEAAYKIVGENELVKAANGLPFAQAAEVAGRILAAGEVGSDRYAEAMTAIYGNEAERRGSQGDWLGAAALADQGAAQIAKSGAGAAGAGTLTGLAASLRRNFVAEAHNRFARAYNTGDYAGARATIAVAIAASAAIMHDDPTLKRDLAAADAALAEAAANN